MLRALDSIVDVSRDEFASRGLRDRDDERKREAIVMRVRSLLDADRSAVKKTGSLT